MKTFAIIVIIAMVICMIIATIISYNKTVANTNNIEKPKIENNFNEKV